MSASGITQAKSTMAFRHAVSRRRMLEAIQAEKGHVDLSDTLREAVDDYIDGYLRRGNGGAGEDAR